MKYCSGCKKKKKETSFYKSSSRGRQSLCKKCNSKYCAVRYKNNKAKVREANVTNRYKKYRLLIEYLLENPCVDCGETNILTLDFDHVRGNKSHNISSMAATLGFSWEKIKLEVEKCEVRCANCHRIKTHKQSNSFKYRFASGHVV